MIFFRQAIFRCFAFLFFLRQVSTDSTNCANHACSTCENSSTLKCKSCNPDRSQNGWDCPCNSGFFDKGVLACSACHITCKTCRNADTQGCYTCDALNFRSLQNSGSVTCPCQWFYSKIPECGAQEGGVDCSTCADTLNKNYPYCDDNKRVLFNGNFCGCLTGYYDDGGAQCKVCSYTCFTCTSASQPYCTSCSIAMNRIIDSDSSCPCAQNYFDNGVANCAACDYSCLTCKGAQPSDCLTCQDSTTSFRSSSGTSCLCQPGYFDSGQTICGGKFSTLFQACHYSCQTCNTNLSSGCISCPSQITTFRSKNGASCQCQQGYYDNFNSICGGIFHFYYSQVCHFSCQTCTNNTNSACSSCNLALFRFTYQTSCLCKAGYFENGKALCGACHSSCLYCTNTSNKNCTSCNSANYRQYSLNQCFCKQGYFDNGGAICGACDVSCQTCINSSNTDCKTCSTTNFRILSQSSCICQAGYFNNGSAVCGGIFQILSIKACDSTCQTCTDATNIGCTSCSALSYRNLSQNSCICQAGYFNNGSAVCGACDSSCQTCTDATNIACTSCNASSYRKRSLNSCICMQGYFLYGSSCVACDMTCGSCSDSTKVGCMSCSPTTFRIFQQNSCSCQTGYFENGYAICGACHYSCFTCQSASDIGCSSCDAKNLRSYQQTQCACLQGYFDNGSAICGACHPTCQTCSIGSSTGCNTCGAENLRIFLTSNNTCSCKPGYVDIGFPKCSIVCDVTCQTCYDFSSQGCLTCNNLYPHFRYISTKNICQCNQGYKESINGTCVPVNCTISQYFDSVYKQCGSCDQSCQTCNGPTKQQCLSCDTNSLRILKNAKCQCGIGYFSTDDQMNCTSSCQSGYQIGNQCYNCHPLCLKCSGGSPLDCTACQLSYYDELNGNQYGYYYYQNSPISLSLTMNSYTCSNSTSTEVSVAEYNSNISVVVTAQNLMTKNIDFFQTYHNLNAEIPKQSFIGGEKYFVSVQVQKEKQMSQSNNLTYQEKNFSTSFNIEIIPIAKTVTIAGGNRVVGNTENFIMKCQIFDLNNQDKPIEDLSQYTFKWSCNPITQDIQCLGKKGIIIDTSSSHHNLSIRAVDLEPYNLYEFHVVVYDTLERNRYNNSVIYQVLDQNIPTMNVIFDSNILALPVNLNLQQQFQFVYPENIHPDNLFYSANLVYNFEVVSTIIYHYSTVNFRIWDYYVGFTRTNGSRLFFKGQVYNPKYLVPSTFTIDIKVNIPPKFCEISVYPKEGVELIDLFLIQVSGCQEVSSLFTYKFAYYQSLRDYELDNQQQSQARASIQTSFQDQNFLSTYLPKSVEGPNIILVISVKDKLGGISNYTKNVIMTPNLIVNETQLMGIIDNITDSTSQLIYLQVICASLRTYDLSFPKITPKIIQLIDKANQFNLSQEEQNQVIQIQAFTSSQTSDLVSLINFSQSISGTLFQQINDAINDTKFNPSSILNQQTHDSLKNLNIIIDSYQILGSLILQNLNEQQKSIPFKNSTQFQNINQQNVQVMELLNQTRQIKIQQLTPNQGTKLLISKYATSAVALTTKKILNDMFGKNIIDDISTDFLTEQTLVSTNEIYTFSYIQYVGNPYSSDQSFPYSDQGFSATDLQITKQFNSSISNSELLKSANIIPSQFISFVIKQKKQSRMLHSKNSSYSNSSSKVTKICLSKIKKEKGWDLQECQTIQQDGKLVCQCNTIRPTTAVEDYDGLFASSNSAIFSTSSFDAINKFQWYKVTLFWIIMVITVIYLVSLPLGWKKDNFDRAQQSKLQYRSKIKELVVEASENMTSRRTPEEKMRIEKRRPNILIVQMEDVKLSIDEKDLITNVIKKNENSQEQQDDKIFDLRIGSKVCLAQDMSGDQKQIKILSNLTIEPQDQNFLANLKSPTFVRRESVTSLVSIQNLRLDVKEQDKKDDVTFFYYFKTKHDYLNIYHSYEDLHRPIRSSLLYLCLISSLAVTLYFGSNLAVGRTIILAILTSIVTSIIMLTLKVLLTARPIILNILGILFFLSLSGFLIFIILAVVSTTESISQTNVWSVQYSIQIIYDSTLGAVVPLAIKYKFFR